MELGSHPARYQYLEREKTCWTLFTLTIYRCKEIYQC